MVLYHLISFAAGAVLVGAAPSAGHLTGDPVVTVVTTEYAFQLPDTLVAGPTAFRVENHGHEPHQLYLARLTRGHTAAELVAALKRGGPPPAWETDVGGPNAVDPGGTSLVTTVNLRPGHYAALCVIPSPDGVPHAMKGMVADVVVRAGARQAAATPARRDPATVAMFDYGYKLSTPITSHTHAITVVNHGKQPHELVLARMQPGKTARDLAAWTEKMQGPPPGSFLGGVSPLAPGQRNELALDLPPGHYAMLCFLPDAKDGKPHVAHGMLHDFVVH